MKEKYRRFRTVITVLVCFAILFCLASCKKRERKSEAVLAVESKIDAIGEVNLDSKEKISEAEEAFLALSEEEAPKVENQEVLNKAKQDLTKLEAEEEARKLEEELNSKASKVDDAISDIGTVTLNSKTKIEAARRQYDNSDDEVKKRVKNLAVLEQAEKDLQVLVEKDREEKAAKVEEKINSIGEVTLDSKDAIIEAETAYNALSYDERVYVKNSSVLDSAKSTYRTLAHDEAEKLLKDCYKQTDAIYNVEFFFPKAIPYSTSGGGWIYDTRSFVLPIVIRNGSSVYMNIIYNYTNSDWVFFEKVVISVDGKVYNKSFNYHDIEHEVNRGNIAEFVEATSVGQSDIDMLKAIGDSEKTIVRFNGDTYYDEFTVSDKDKKAILQMVKIYEYLKA